MGATASQLRSALMDNFSPRFKSLMKNRYWYANRILKHRGDLTCALTDVANRVSCECHHDHFVVMGLVVHVLPCIGVVQILSTVVDYVLNQKAIVTLL